MLAGIFSCISKEQTEAECGAECRRFQAALVPRPVSSRSRSSCLLMRFASTDTSAQKRGHGEAYAMTRVDRLCCYVDEDFCRPQSQDVIPREVKGPSRQKVRMETQTSPNNYRGQKSVKGSQALSKLKHVLSWCLALKSCPLAMTPFVL